MLRYIARNLEQALQLTQSYLSDEYSSRMNNILLEDSANMIGMQFYGGSGYANRMSMGGVVKSNTLRVAIRSPEFWGNLLNELDSRGIELVDKPVREAVYKIGVALKTEIQRQIIQQNLYYTGSLYNAITIWSGRTAQSYKSGNIDSKSVYLTVGISRSASLYGAQPSSAHVPAIYATALHNGQAGWGSTGDGLAIERVQKWVIDRMSFQNAVDDAEAKRASRAIAITILRSGTTPHQFISDALASFSAEQAIQDCADQIQAEFDDITRN